MSTLSVPLTPNLEAFIDAMVASGRATNKADVARRALVKMAEDQAIQDVLDAMQELKEGKILRGNLDDLLKRVA